MIPFVNELKSEALKDRHWKDMIKILDLTGTWTNMSDMTLREIWEQADNLKKNESLLREVMVGAQGEKALEEFLKQISEQWKVYQLELIDYQKKCKLIKSWDDLFTRAKENLGNILSMKLSPYFKVTSRSRSSFVRTFVLPGFRSRDTVMGRQTQSYHQHLRYLDRCSTSVGLSRRDLHVIDGHRPATAERITEVPECSQRFRRSTEESGEIAARDGRHRHRQRSEASRTSR